MATWQIGYNAAGSAQDFTTIALFFASGSVNAGDTGELNYSSATRNRLFYETVSFNKAITLRSKTRHTTGIYGTITISAAGGSLEDCWVVGQVTSTANCTVKRCILDGTYAVAYCVYNATAGVTCDVESCLTIASNTSSVVSNNATATINCKHVTCIDPYYSAFYEVSGSIVCTNCVVVSCRAASGAYAGGFLGCTGSYNASFNLTNVPGGAERVLLTGIDAKFICDADLNGYSIRDARVIRGSGLLGVGTDAGVTLDINGQTMSAPFPIGCSAGVEMIDPAKVLTTATPAGTFDEAARNTDPGVANVKISTAYKIQNVSKTGTYAAGSTPDAPTISAVSVGDGTVTVNISLNAADDPAYLVWTMLGRSASWTSPSVSYKVTADGNLTVSGLTNYREYAFAVISESGGVYSQHSDTLVIETPRPTTADVAVRMRDQIAGAATQMLQRSGIGTIVYFREYPGAALVTLWASLDDGGSIQQLQRGGQTDIESLTITIPRQTDFPPSAGFKPGCEIHIGSTVYEIDTIQHDRATESLSSSFKVSIFRHSHF